jgi:hypothetical protein
VPQSLAQATSHLIASDSMTVARSDALAHLIIVLSKTYDELPAEVASAYEQVLDKFR